MQRYFRKTRRAPQALALLLLCATFGFTQETGAPAERLTAATLPQFFTQYEKTLSSVGEAFADLEKQKLPLFDESGRPLGRRNIQDRSKELVEVRGDIERLAAKPEDLVLTMTFFNHAERLADEVYDLSQVALDNDQEELGKQLTDLVNTLDSDQDRIEEYALNLAAAKQQQIETLEQQNKTLQEKSKGTRKPRQPEAARSARGEGARRPS
jgi:hypothetical protein